MGTNAKGTEYESAPKARLLAPKARLLAPKARLLAPKARLLAPKARFLALKARNMIARGKREARRPWISVKEKWGALKGRNTAASISAFQASTILFNSNQGRRARFARACPWLSYFAPLALSRTYL